MSDLAWLRLIEEYENLRAGTPRESAVTMAIDIGLGVARVPLEAMIDTIREGVRGFSAWLQISSKHDAASENTLLNFASSIVQRT